MSPQTETSPTITAQHPTRTRASRRARSTALCICCRLVRSRKDQCSPELAGRCERCAEIDAVPLISLATLQTTPAAQPVCVSPAQPKASTDDRPLNPDIALAVRFVVGDGLTDYEIRVGLRSAWRQRVHGRFPAAAVTSAARAWFADYDSDRRGQGTRNTKALRALTTVAQMI